MQKLVQVLSKLVNADNVRELNPARNKVLKKSTNDKAQKIWVKLGGFLELTEDQISDLRKMDRETSEYIIEEALRKRGFTAHGEVYDPEDEEWAFELNGEYKLKI